MWGYIGSRWMSFAHPWVPSLYVRVYRSQQTTRPDTTRSLIICEGISRTNSNRIPSTTFPHYMWGYIAVAYIAIVGRLVPSLYVRVYRRIYKSAVYYCRSLIICEGISGLRWTASPPLTFPHYMWGYIICVEPCKKFFAVPSLYVRVYRGMGLLFRETSRSLIICEGISFRFFRFFRCELFPHYMWGYIIWRAYLWKWQCVPSLYARVYRCMSRWKNRLRCSLIIREGISDKSLTSYDYGLFPHYMWGYIEIGNGILQASKNINVVDDSIPQIA